MSSSLKLGKKDRGFLLIVLAIFVCIILGASFLIPDLYLVVAFNTIFIFSLFFYLMLFLNKHDLGKARAPKVFPSITVIIPCFNSKNTIVGCIDSIKKIKYKNKVNILVVDDCSTDGSRELLQKMNGIELIALKENSGRSFAVNTALAKVKTEFVICIDSDSYPEEDVLMKTMGYFDDEKVASVSCLVLPDKKDNLLRKIQALEYAISFGLANTLLASINSSYVVPGPFTIFRKKVFDIVGYYEEGNLAEDMDFGLRMKNHSMKLMNCHDAVVYTDVPASIKGLFVQRNRWYRGGAFNFVKHKQLLFNKKNPDFGFFVMPFLFASQVLIVAVILRLLLFFGKDFYVGASIFIDYILLGGFISINLPPTIFSPAILFFLATYTLITIYFLVCFIEVNYKLTLKDFFPLLMLIFIYPYFITFTYSQSYFKEIIGVEEKWRRVST
ncbi:MAG: glycosyltransferase family 2 protein [archaeon]|jgi:cellulose synthase/poly-beta-1,6-N-acetylglucosamine synthase-like glycosyltransferase